jgi:hypothetical protein
VAIHLPPDSLGGRSMTTTKGTLLLIQRDGDDIKKSGSILKKCNFIKVLID